jgi:hypothetical protein
MNRNKDNFIFIHNQQKKYKETKKTNKMCAMLTLCVEIDIQSATHLHTKAKQAMTMATTHTKSTLPKLANELSNYSKLPISTELRSRTF